MMQKAQMGGGVISPAVTAHVQKNSAQPVRTARAPKVLPATKVGGGIISPNLTRHVMAQSVKVSMGGGMIHPNVAQHVQAQ